MIYQNSRTLAAHRFPKNDAHTIVPQSLIRISGEGFWNWPKLDEISKGSSDPHNQYGF